MSYNKVNLLWILKLLSDFVRGAAFVMPCLLGLLGDGIFSFLYETRWVSGLISSCGPNAARMRPLGGAKGAKLASAPLCSSSLDSEGKQTCFRQTSPLMNDLHKDASDWKRKESQPWKSRDKQTRVSSSEEKNPVNRVILVFTCNNGGRACACLDYFFLFPISHNLFKKDKWVMEELIKCWY